MIRGNLKVAYEALKQEVEQQLINKVNSDPSLHNVYLLVHSERLNIHWPMAAGSTDGVAATPDQPFHTASVGKTFTSVILTQLVESGLARFDDPIAKYLPPELIQGMHIYKGKDYSQDIQIKHLLSNTSGLPDFFEEKPKHRPSMLQEVLDDPQRFWTPRDTVEWSKEHLRPHFPPGKKVYYTDTGYNLLGMVIESITGSSYEEVLHERIFRPLQMNHSYLSQFSLPALQSAAPTAHLYLDHIKIEVDQYRSLSSFYSGGQTVCTLADLLIFMKALVKGQLVRKESLRVMQTWRPLQMGLRYGYGLMQLRFLPFTSKYTVWGGLGASGAFMLYVPAMDVYLAGTFNQTTYRTKAMNYLFFNVLRKLGNISK